MMAVTFGLMVAAVLATTDAPAVPLIPTAPITQSAPQDGNRIAARTVVNITIAAALSSRTAQIGDMFVIRLADPVVVDGRLLLPVGTKGWGEVVHANKAKGAGKAGELIVMARYLECGEGRIPLGHFHFGASGESHAGEALAVSLIVPFAGFFVSGNDIDVPMGTRGNARITADVVLSLDAAGQCVRVS